MFGYLATLLCGATGVLLPRWKAEEALALTERHRCTYVLYMPTHGADIIRAGRESTRELSSMRVLVAPGLSQERRIAMHEVFGLRPIADYGLSEVPGPCRAWLVGAVGQDDQDRGHPIPRNRRPDPRSSSANPLPPGEVGAVVVNGPSRFLGFLANDELTRDSLTEWGAYKTGDIGYLDADGHLIYGGRSKDIIRRGGVTLVPAEIEAAIVRHPRNPGGGGRAAARRPPRRAGVRGGRARARKRRPDLTELQEFLAVRGRVESTRGPSRSRCLTSFRERRRSRSSSATSSRRSSTRATAPA